MTMGDVEQTPYCGFGTCRPSVLQRFANLPSFSISFSVCSVFWAALNVYLSSQVPTIEKQFKLSSTMSGVLVSTLQYGYIVALLFVSHFGKRTHIPRLLSILSFSVGVIALIPAICQLASLPALQESSVSSVANNSMANTLQKSESFLCTPLSSAIESGTNVSVGKTELPKSDSSGMWIVYVLGLSSVMIGISRSAQISLPIHYIDNNVKDHSRTGLLGGTVLTATLLGLPMALAVGTLTSRLPINLRDTALTPEDPRWIGAWWVGFIFLGLGSIILGIPVFFFPRQFQHQQPHHQAEQTKDLPKGDVPNPNPKTQSGETRSKLDDQSKEKARNGVQEQQKNMVPGTLQEDHQNPEKNTSDHEKPEKSFISDKAKVGKTKSAQENNNTLTQYGSDTTLGQGHAKEEDMKEFIKNLPLSIMRLLREPIIVLLAFSAVSIGMVVGAFQAFASKYIVLQFNMTLWRANMFLSISGVIASVLGTFCGGWFITKLKLNRRGTLRFAMIIAIVGILAQFLNIFFGCNNQRIVGHQGVPVNKSMDCDCDPNRVLLSCGQDGRSYLSPCFAQCTNVTNTVYGGCKGLDYGDSVRPGLCDTDCKFFVPFLLAATVTAIAAQMSVMPILISTLRTVQDSDKSIMIALLSLCMSLAGHLPGPILFGKVVDSTCLIWSNAASASGSCLLYDIQQMRYSVIGGLLALKVICFVFVTAAFIYDVCAGKRTAGKEKCVNDVVEVKGEPLFVTTRL